jgi:hypothetical protein
MTPSKNERDRVPSSHFICSSEKGLVKTESTGDPCPCCGPESHPETQMYQGIAGRSLRSMGYSYLGRSGGGTANLLERVSESVRLRTGTAFCIDSLGEVNIHSSATSSPPEARALSWREGGEAPGERCSSTRGCTWWGNRIGPFQYLPIDYLGAGKEWASRGPSTHLALDQNWPHPELNVETQERTGVDRMDPLSNLPAAGRGACSAPDPLLGLHDVPSTFAPTDEDSSSSRRGKFREESETRRPRMTPCQDNPWSQDNPRETRSWYRESRNPVTSERSPRVEALH